VRVEGPLDLGAARPIVPIHPACGGVTSDCIGR